MADGLLGKASGLGTVRPAAKGLKSLLFVWDVNETVGRWEGGNAGTWGRGAVWPRGSTEQGIEGSRDRERTGNGKAAHML